MTDYYPLIARAIAGLDRSTGESRRVLYERARNALVAQLRNLDPPLSESEITRERLALEEAIRKIEGEAARQPARPLPPGAAAKAKPPAQAARPERPASSDQDRSAAAARQSAPSAPSTPRPSIPESKPEAKPGDKPGGSFTLEELRIRNRERSELAAAAVLKGFRDVIAEVDKEEDAPPGSKPVQPIADAKQEPGRPAKPERNAWAPASVPELDRLEPRIEPPGRRMSARDSMPRTGEPPRTRSEPPLPRMESRPSPPQSLARQPSQAVPIEPPRRGSARALFAALLGVFIMVALGLGVYWLRGPIAAVFKRSPATQAQQPVQQRPKIADRVGQGGQPNSTGQPGAAQSPAAAVAQHVVLYEEDPADAQGKRYVGSVIWRTEMVSPGAGQTPELAIKADLEIPDRRMNMTLSIRRNTDKALPASHTIEILFNLPPDFPFGGISNVPGILMKQAEQTRGAPLAGLAVKVTSGFFLVGLSASDGDMQRNLELLKERTWFDIPVVYNNGRRAILAVEKGTPGERAFKEAFAAWGG
jgi:hypothetical protein